MMTRNGCLSFNAIGGIYQNTLCTVPTASFVRWRSTSKPNHRPGSLTKPSLRPGSLSRPSLRPGSISKPSLLPEVRPSHGVKVRETKKRNLTLLLSRIERLRVDLKTAQSKSDEADTKQLMEAVSALTGVFGAAQPPSSDSTYQSLLPMSHGEGHEFSLDELRVRMQELGDATRSVANQIKILEQKRTTPKRWPHARMFADEQDVSSTRTQLKSE